MSENVGAKGRLTARQEWAALEVALDQRPDVEIAKLVGITDRQLLRWKQLEEFAGRVAELRAAMARAVEGKGIADRQARVSKLQDLLDRMTLIVEGRAEDLGEVPGGRSGLLTRQYKQTGKDSYEVEYAFDAALPREMRAVMQQAAQELGQWVQKVAPTDPTGQKEYDALSDAEKVKRAMALLDLARQRQEQEQSEGQDERGQDRSTSRASLPRDETEDRRGPER